MSTTTARETLSLPLSSAYAARALQDQTRRPRRAEAIRMASYAAHLRREAIKAADRDDVDAMIELDYEAADVESDLRRSGYAGLIVPSFFL